MVNMQHDRIDEYHALTEEQKSMYIKQYEEERESRKFGTRLSQVGRANDMSHICGELEKMVSFRIVLSYVILSDHHTLDLRSQE